MEGTSIVVNDYLSRVQDILTANEIEVAKNNRGSNKQNYRQEGQKGVL